MALRGERHVRSTKGGGRREWGRKSHTHKREGNKEEKERGNMLANGMVALVVQAFRSITPVTRRTDQKTRLAWMQSEPSREEPSNPGQDYQQRTDPSPKNAGDLQD